MLTGAKVPNLADTTSAVEVQLKSPAKQAIIRSGFNHWPGA